MNKHTLEVLLISLIIVLFSSTVHAINTVWYSCSPYGTGDIKTGTPNITISSGVATLSVAQTGNIGAGDCIEFGTSKVYIAPNRLGFDSGGTTEIKPGDKIQGGTSGATGIVRIVEVTSGSWAGGDATGYIYFETTNGTWQDNETINRIRPTSSSNAATVSGTLQGNIGNGNTQFVVKTATGGTPADQSSTTVTSIHHEYSSLSSLEAGFTDSNHLNSTDLTSAGADVIVLACCYYDHDDQTADTTGVTIDFGTVDPSHYLYVFTPVGGSESINNQRHGGKKDTSRYLITTSSGTVVSVVELYTILDGLQIDTTSTSSVTVVSLQVSQCTVKNCVISVSATGTVANNGVRISTSGYYAYVENCLFVDILSSSGGGAIVDGSISGVYLYIKNCTIADSNKGVVVPASSYRAVVNNTLVSGCDSGSGFVGDFNSSSDYNASSDFTSTGGANDRTNQTFTFVDEVNGDYHLSPLDAGAKDHGTALSSASTHPIWRDIDREDRVGGTWDIGFDEVISTSSYLTIDGVSASKVDGANYATVD